MWNKLLGLNMLVLWPAATILFIYTIGRAVFHGEWFSLAIGAGLFVLGFVTQLVLGSLSD